MKRFAIFMASAALAVFVASASAACGDFEIACYTNENCESGQACLGGDAASDTIGTCVEGDGDGDGGGSSSSSTAQSSSASGPVTVPCTDDADCTSGNFCDGNLCSPCVTDDHCGESCQACTGLFPTCNALLGTCGL